MGELKTKRVYDPWETDDGYRVLVDRLWPRGITKEKAMLDEWAKEFTPSGDLRKAWHQGIVGWEEFAKTYEEELKSNANFSLWKDSLKKILKDENVTLLTAAELKPENHVKILLQALL